MFNGRTNDVTSVSRGGVVCQAQDREVVALSGARSEVHLFGFATNDARDGFACLFDSSLGLLTKLMCAAAGIAILNVEVFEHYRPNFGVEWRCGVAIEINGHWSSGQ